MPEANQDGHYHFVFWCGSALNLCLTLCFLHSLSTHSALFCADLPFLWAVRSRSLPTQTGRAGAGFVGKALGFWSFTSGRRGRKRRPSKRAVPSGRSARAIVRTELWLCFVEWHQWDSNGSKQTVVSSLTHGAEVFVRTSSQPSLQTIEPGPSLGFILFSSN